MGVADLCLVADGAHDMDSTAVFINGIAHRFPIDSQTFVLFPIKVVPLNDGVIQVYGVDTDENITDDEKTRNTM